jgi:hypothetical protein
MMLDQTYVSENIPESLLKRRRMSSSAKRKSTPVTPKKGLTGMAFPQADA